ncbi:polysaccharide pyruvyl transferase family protein, partial [Vibrio sp. 10N.222.49.C9]|uniref:polysaccharide pyruvyl transferase family protein n=1 Tax=Vibrio sp. 10N.222.49.C9 TaxID=3229615 RepID=UPI003550A3FD
EGSKNNFKNHLQDYSSVSVRDKKGQRILHDEFGIEAQVTLDPTLMLNKEQWLDFGFQEKNSIKEKGSYIAFYLITHSFNPTPYIYELLKELQLKTGHKVMSFSDIPDKYDIKYEKCSGMG